MSHFFLTSMSQIWFELCQVELHNSSNFLLEIFPLEFPFFIYSSLSHSKKWRPFFRPAELGWKKLFLHFENFENSLRIWKGIKTFKRDEEGTFKRDRNLQNFQVRMCFWFLSKFIKEKKTEILERFQISFCIGIEKNFRFQFNFLLMKNWKKYQTLVVIL